MSSRRGGEQEEDEDDDRRQLGLTDEQIEVMHDGDDDGDGACEIWPENLDALQVFLACASKWTLGGLGGVVGLDDTRMANVLRWKRVKDKWAMFEDLRVMERAALPELNRSKPSD